MEGGKIFTRESDFGSCSYVTLSTSNSSDRELKKVQGLLYAWNPIVPKHFPQIIKISSTKCFTNKTVYIFY